MAPQGIFTQLSTLEAEHSTREAPMAQFIRQKHSPSVCGAPQLSGGEEWAAMEYTDRLMAAVDAAQLDFTSLLLKEAASPPC